MEMNMNVFPKVLCGWSWEENKLFELALAVVDEQDPNRWEIVAALVGGKKSAEDVHKHYVILLEDLKVIESGILDHKLGGVGEAQKHNYVQVDSTQSLCWTDENNKYVNLFVHQVLVIYNCLAFLHSFLLSLFMILILYIDISYTTLFFTIWVSLVFAWYKRSR